MKLKKLIDSLIYFFPSIRWWHYTILIALIGLIIIAITPPYQVPDEPDHFFRAFQLSQGQIIGKKTEMGSGGYLPKAVPNEANQFANIPFKPEQKLTIREIQAQYRQSPVLDEVTLSDKEFVSFPYTVLYSPVPYIASATAVGFSKLLSLKLFTSFYFARVINFILSLAIVSFAFYLIEKWHKPRLLLFFFLAAMPMSIFVLASVSADSFTNSISFLICALIFKLEKQWSEKYFKIFLTATVLISLCKSFYSFLPLMIIPVIFFKNENWNFRQKLTKMLILSFAIIIPNLIWLKLVENIYTPGHTGADAKLQLAFYLENFWTVNQIIITNFFQKLTFYQHSFIGILGWLDTYLHPQINRFYLRFLFLLAFIGIAATTINKKKAQTRSRHKPQLKSYFFKTFRELFQFKYITMRIFIVAAFLLLGFYLLNISQYLAWVPVGELTIKGVQGRYFIPLSIFFFTAFPIIIKVPKSLYKIVTSIAVGLWLFVAVHTSMIILERYWRY